jgi:hypothetical protein
MVVRKTEHMPVIKPYVRRVGIGNLPNYPPNNHREWESGSKRGGAVGVLVSE